jgi:hypothetical protein
MTSTRCALIALCHGDDKGQGARRILDEKRMPVIRARGGEIVANDETNTSLKLFITALFSLPSGT